MGITVLVARYLGEKRSDLIGPVIGGSIVIFAILSCVLFVGMSASPAPSPS